MEKLVALPFSEGTVLLSSADILALVVTGRGNRRSKAQLALKPHHREMRGTGPPNLDTLVPDHDD